MDGSVTLGEQRIRRVRPLRVVLDDLVLRRDVLARERPEVAASGGHLEPRAFRGQAAAVDDRVEAAEREAKRKLIRDGKGDKAAEIATVEAEIAKCKAKKFPAAANAQSLAERVAPANAAMVAADTAAKATKKKCGKKKACKSAYRKALKENMAVYDAAVLKAKNDNLKARNSALAKEVLRATMFFSLRLLVAVAILSSSVIPF